MLPRCGGNGCGGGSDATAVDHAGPSAVRIYLCAVFGDVAAFVRGLHILGWFMTLRSGVACGPAITVAVKGWNGEARNLADCS